MAGPDNRHQGADRAQVFDEEGRGFWTTCKSPQNAIRFYTSPPGRVLSQSIAEGRSDPELLKAFQERFQEPRRKAVQVTWERGG